ncbi:MAG: hypothetical protein WDO13_14915 [Verrucomicrobiota bacterium]
MRANLKPWLILAVIFVAGGVTGAALTVALSGHFLHPPPPPGSEVQMRDHWLARLTWQLKLTSDQQAKIEPILGDAAMRIQTLHHQEVDKVAQIFKENGRQDFRPAQRPAAAGADSHRGGAPAARSPIACARGVPSTTGTTTRKMLRRRPARKMRHRRGRIRRRRRSRNWRGKIFF